MCVRKREGLKQCLNGTMSSTIFVGKMGSSRESKMGAPPGDAKARTRVGQL